VADTTAMSVQHEIDYQIIFDASSAQATSNGQPMQALPVVCGIASLVAVGCAVLVIRRKKA
jgi:hypothetical protein